MADLPVKVLDVTPNSILLLEGEKRTRLIPANTFNTLKYVIKGSFEGMIGQSHTKIYLGDNCVISRQRRNMFSALSMMEIWCTPRLMQINSYAKLS